MRHKEEFVLTLKDGTPKLFNLWQDLGPEINRIAESSKLIIASVVYDQEKMTKSCDVYYDSQLHFLQAVLGVEQLSVPKGIIVEVVSRKTVPCDCHLVPEILALVCEHKNKYQF